MEGSPAEDDGTIYNICFCFLKKFRTKENGIGNYSEPDRTYTSRNSDFVLNFIIQDLH